MYSLIQAISIVIWIVFYMFYGKHMNLSKPKSLIVSLYSFILTYFGIFLLTWIESGFKNFGNQNAVRAFTLIVPILWTEKKIFGLDFRKNLDYQSLWPMIWYGFGHFACMYPYCCHSFHYYEGTTLYNISHFLTGKDMFPQQLCEGICALLIALVLWLILRKHNYYIGGRAFFIMLLLYGAQRFLWEFFRDNEKVIVFKEMSFAFSSSGNQAVWGISNLAFWALFMVAIGIIGLAVLNHTDKKAAKQEQSSLHISNMGGNKQ